MARQGERGRIMNIVFSDAHLDTLMKLKEVAEKHGMKIRFGTRSSFSDDDTDLSDFKEEFSEEALELLEDYIDDILDGTVRTSNESIWFELYEPNTQEKNGAYHVMTYEQNETWFFLKEDWQNELENYIWELDEDDKSYEKDSKKAQSLIDYLENVENNYVSINHSPTTITGFGKPKVVDGRVYREGMALHFFTELVCEYLKEPMIHNTY